MRARHLLAAGLALAGSVLAAYLTLVQTDTVRSAWDPFFGTGTERVLHSSVTGLLPVPDALLGAVAYAGEAALLVLTVTRFGRRRWLTLLLEAGTVGFALAGLGLVAVQAFVVHAWCTLCLASALLSWTILLLVGLSRRPRSGCSNRPGDGPC
ncbi:vitamin K epoxide reductase family protein [Nocardioides montaniterrae]